MPDKVALELASQISRQNVSKEGWTTYYVDGTNGNDGANGLTWESAFKTVQQAIDIAKSWAKIYVKAGTYVENVTIDKEGIHLIGEKINTTIIKPSSAKAIYITGNNCFIEFLSAIGNGTGTSNSGIHLHAKYGNLTNIIVGNQDTNGFGLIVADQYVMCDKIFIDQSNKPAYGIQYESKYGKIKNCIIENVGQDAIILLEEACYWNMVYENTIINAGRYGIKLSGFGCNWNSIFHNNIISSGTENVRDTSPNDNKFFENFYDDHTVDINNNGICDIPYTFTTGVDYSPVSRRNGWNQVSLGIDKGTKTTGIHKVYPTLAAAVLTTSSAIAWTMGNYAEIIPVNTVTSDFYLTNIVFNNLVIDSEYEVDIATGLAAAESVIATVTHETNDSNLAIIIPISPPIFISANSRISARAATENAAADICTIKLMYKI